MKKPLFGIRRYTGVIPAFVQPSQELIFLTSTSIFNILPGRTFADKKNQDFDSLQRIFGLQYLPPHIPPIRVVDHGCMGANPIDLENKIMIVS
jgi:hypothetical protein